MHFGVQTAWIQLDGIDLLTKYKQINELAKQKSLVKQIYDLALLSQNMLVGAELTAFVKRTVEGL